MQGDREAPSINARRHSIERRVLTVALGLVGAGRGCGDGTSAGCVIVVAAFKAPTFVATLDDIAVVSETIEVRS
jgi:hypothetical protein